MYHNRVDWRVEAQCFANDTVENREFLHFFVCHGAKGSVRVGEMFQLLLIQKIAEKTVNRSQGKPNEETYATAGLFARCITVQATLEELVC
jgi:hypothetical protein